MAEPTEESPTAEQSPTQEQSPTSEIPTQLQSVLAANPVQVDDALDNTNDSTYNESLGEGSQVTSLKSSIVNYKYENGRRYHAFREGSYLMPNDEDEQDRMDLVHHICRLVLGGKLYLAPIDESVQRILDLGTGTGIWAMDVADEHPSAEVLGIDLSPIQPQWTPPNCSFQVDDFESDWLYSKPFDFIHARELEGCMSNETRLFKQALEHLKPGGYFEIQAIFARFVSDDDTVEKAPNCQLWMKTLCEGMAQFGKPMDHAPQWKGMLEEAGFDDVQEEVFKIPIGSWPKDPKLKEIGGVQYYQELQAVDSYTPAVFSRVLGWSDTEIDVFIAKVKKELKDPSIHLYFPIHYVWGRKPS